MKLILAVVGGSLLMIMIIIFIFSGGGQQGSGKIEITPVYYDVGTISMAAGPIKKVFEIKNVGKSDLKINEIRTSCMCTTAKLKVGDKESPEFGMHTSLLFWSQKIAPGQTAYLEVTFDPAYHGPQGVGDIVRAVYISSSDSQNKKVEVRLLAKVIP